MGLVAKFGELTGRHLASKFVGRGHKFHQIVGREIGAELGKNAARMIPIIGSFKKGGYVKKTGAYILHKGETVIAVRKKKRKH